MDLLVLDMCTSVSKADESILGYDLFTKFNFKSNTSKTYCIIPLRMIRSQLS